MGRKSLQDNTETSHGIHLALPGKHEMEAKVEALNRLWSSSSAAKTRTDTVTKNIEEQRKKDG